MYLATSDTVIWNFAERDMLEGPALCLSLHTQTNTY